MEQSLPTTHLVKGLRNLVDSLNDHEGSTPNRSGGYRSPLMNSVDGSLSYCESEVRELCESGCFESVMWLLVNRSMPDSEQLADSASVLFDSAVVDRPLLEAIGSIPLQTRPLELLPLSISLLSCFDPAANDSSADATRGQFWRLMAQLPVLLHSALGGKLQFGRPVFDGTAGEAGHSEAGHSEAGHSEADHSEADNEARPVDVPASWAGRLLQILRDDDRCVTASEEHAMNVLMTCQCITENRVADQTARFVGGAVTDVTAAWKASSSVFVSQLRKDPFFWTSSVLRSFGNPSDAEQWWFARQRKPMPFGFSDEPEGETSRILREQCRELLGSIPAMVMEASASRLESILAESGRYPTADWTATRLLTLLGIPEDRISVAIGLARMVGWAAHHLDVCERGTAA